MITYSDSTGKTVQENVFCLYGTILNLVTKVAQTLPKSDQFMFNMQTGKCHPYGLISNKYIAKYKYGIIGCIFDSKKMASSMKNIKVPTNILKKMAAYLFKLSYGLMSNKYIANYIYGKVCCIFLTAYLSSSHKVNVT